MTASDRLKKTKKVSGIIAGVLTATVIIFSLVLSVSSIIAKQKNQSVNFFGYSFNIVVSGSMEPEIKKGDLVISKKTDVKYIKEGMDIIFLSDDPNLKDLRIVHRVQTVNGDGSFITYHLNEEINGQNVKGHYVDSFAAVRIEGKVVAVSGGFGKIFLFFSSFYNLIFIFMIIVLAFIIFSQTINIVKVVRQKKIDKQPEKQDVLDEVLSEIEKEYGKNAIEILKNKDKDK